MAVSIAVNVHESSAIVGTLGHRWESRGPLALTGHAG